MNTLKEVIQLDKLVSETKGRFVWEKIYHGALDEDRTIGGGAVMWSTFLHNKNKWSKWHVAYFIIGQEYYFTNYGEFLHAAAEYRKYGTLKIV